MTTAFVEMPAAHMSSVNCNYLPIENRVTVSRGEEENMCCVTRLKKGV